MKALITIAIVVTCLWLIKQLDIKYQEVKRRSGPDPVPEQAQTANAPLPGMPVTLDESLAAAQKQGAEGLGNFLRQYGHHIRDPRLAALELDYVVLLSLKNPEEARRIFKAVQARTPPSSPVYGRIKRLEKTYQ